MRPLRDKFRLNLTGILDRPESLEEMLPVIPEIQDIFLRAKEKAATWNGEIVFVYLPSIHQMLSGTGKSQEEGVRDAMLESMVQIGVRHIDLTKVFASDPNPEDNLWHFPGSHYSEKGYALAAEGTLRALQAAGAQ